MKMLAGANERVPRSMAPHETLVDKDKKSTGRIGKHWQTLTNTGKHW
jgi:hypothetical protein